MGADDENSFGISLQGTNQVLLLATFDRLLGKALAVASCFHKHSFEIYLTLVVVSSESTKSTINRFSAHLSKTDVSLLSKNAGRVQTNESGQDWQSGENFHVEMLSHAAKTGQAHSLTCRRNGDNAFIAVDLHCRLQSSGAAANTREKLLRAGTLH